MKWVPDEGEGQNFLARASLAQSDPMERMFRIENVAIGVSIAMVIEENHVAYRRIANFSVSYIA